MSDWESQLDGVVDKQALLKIVTDLPEDATAVIVTCVGRDVYEYHTYGDNFNYPLLAGMLKWADHRLFDMFRRLVRDFSE